jgi:hypothetical protein
VITDHSATTGIARQTSLTSSSVDKLNQRLVRASQYLSQFDLDIRWRPGKSHTVPDALSRLPADGKSTQEDTLDALTFNITVVEIDPAFKRELQQAYQHDWFWNRQKVTEVEELPLQEIPPDQFLRHDGLIYHTDKEDGRYRLCIPKSLQGDVFEQAHGVLHHGFHRVYTRVRQNYYIWKLAKRLRKYLHHCQDCRRIEILRHPPNGALQPIESPPKPFHTITIDIVTGLPEWEGRNAILTVTDKFSKRVTIAAGRHDYGAKDWATPLLDALADWGLPVAIISDRDTRWISQLWRELFLKTNTKLLTSTAYHPQTDGQSERTNQTVETALRYLISQGKTDWPNWLPLIRMTLNNCRSEATDHSPNELLYGFPIREGFELTDLSEEALRDGRIERVATRDDYATQRSVAQQEARDAVAWALFKMKQRDRRHPITFRPGDQVYIRLHHGYRIPGQNRKVGLLRVGPRVVLEAYRNAYRVDLPPNWHIHPVISVEQLEPAPEPHQDPFERTRHDPNVVVEEEGEALEEIQRITESRIRRKGRNRREYLEYFVLFTNRGAEDGRWIDVNELHQRAPLKLYQFERGRIDSPIHRFIEMPPRDEDLTRRCFRPRVVIQAPPNRLSLMPRR